MNLFTVSFLAGVFIPVLIQIYGKLSEISGKRRGRLAANPSRC
ncbi:MAG: hypothetical protein WA977_12985 [Halobacteriota archaeon]